MNLKEVLKENYKEDMTLQEVEEALKEIDLVDPSQFEGFVSKEKLDKATSEAADWKRKYNETLSDAEKAELKQQEMETEIANYKRSEMIFKAKADLIGSGYSEDKAEELATAQVDGDTNKVLAIIKADREAIAQAHKEELDLQKLSDIPRPSNAQGEVEKTFKDMTLDERAKLKAEDPEAYEVAKGGNE